MTTCYIVINREWRGDAQGGAMAVVTDPIEILKLRTRVRAFVANACTGVVPEQEVTGE